MSKEVKPLKLDYEAISLFVKIYGESIKKFVETGDFDIKDIEEKVIENLDEVIEYKEERET